MKKNNKRYNKIKKLNKKISKISIPAFEAEVMFVGRSFGFILDKNTGEEFFVRRRGLMAAITGDIVLAKVVANNEEGHENRLAEVVKIIAESENLLTGVIVEGEDINKKSKKRELFLLPDSFCAAPLKINNWNTNKITACDKVKYKIFKRGTKYSDHIVDIITIYGNSDIARVSVMAYLEEKNIPTVFSAAVLNEVRAAENCASKTVNSFNPVIDEKEISRRLDLRKELIFTIDGSDTKDIDDAISIEKTEKGYILGVHIADVSYYVKAGSELDKEAFHRGNSVYIADLVFPMLPKELSNGICSLNPGKERLALSCIMEISEQGELLDFSFKKTVIKSVIQGVYEEINTVLAGNAVKALNDKYSSLIEKLKISAALAAKLKANRDRRGSPMLITSESKIICDENGKAIDIINREGGVSENIIEEFMLMANTAAARLAMKNDLPFVYRVHEPPTDEKLEILSESLVFLGIDNSGINSKSKPAHLAALLKRVQNSDKAGVINTLVLRAMMKARYSDEPLGHYGLATDEYTHFTSPIRRYSDLFVHRVLSDYINGLNEEGMIKRYKKFASNAAAHSSNTEFKAVCAERDCDKFYMAEYMSDKKDHEFDGIIAGVMANGFFVRLPNTVEGRVDTINLPFDEYTVEHNISLVGKNTKKRYTIGDKINVKCVSCNIAAGTIEFVIINPPILT